MVKKSFKKKSRRFWERSYTDLCSVACGQFNIDDEEKVKKIRRRIENRLRTDRKAVKVAALLFDIDLDV